MQLPCKATRAGSPCHVSPCHVSPCHVSPCHNQSHNPGMTRNLSILALLAAIVALPFVVRRTDDATAWRDGDPVLVIVTPHNEAIRQEFERGFARWHQGKYGRPVKVEWR